MFCKNCGKELDDKAVICPGCGVATDNFKIQQEQTTQTNVPQPITIVNTNTNTNTNFMRAPKNKWIALVLCILGFLGFAGFHRFYAGKIGSGILYFLTAGIFGIGTIIDAILILVGNFKDKYGVPMA